ncbi:MAG: HlyD family type I secretion periplasmic adaptor subunit [Rhodospirillaceae bacterium]|nr:HlyD family type I secretion periplasmic adaptor subunit [Rhodospirillales bacterium]
MRLIHISTLDGRRSREPIVSGMVLIAVLMGGFGTWASLAPLARGAVAPGNIMAEGHRKAVQHLEGGIVAEILVQDGDAVTVGQPLIRLDGAQAHAKMASLSGSRDALAARLARLEAEYRDSPALVMPTRLEDRDNRAQIAELWDAEHQLFVARRQALQSELGLIEQKRHEENGRIKGLESQVTANRLQLRLTRDELADQRQLLEKGFTRRPRVLDLERREADLAGRSGSLMADISQARMRIAEAGIEGMKTRHAFQEKVLADLRATQDETAKLDKELDGLRDVLSRLDIRATVTGDVHDLKVRTVGGVIAPGDALLEIVPAGGALVLEARISPTDIEHVSVGTPADVRFTGLSQRTTPTVTGTVFTVSPDVMIDKATNQPYYQARLRVAEPNTRG